MATFVLVPGWWLGGWAWQDVARELAANGSDVHPVTLTGMAERAAEATPDVNVDTHVQDILEVIKARDMRDVVLVAHSGANMAATGAADLVPGVVKRLVYVDTGPMPSGMASIDFNPPEQQQQLRDLVAREGDGWLVPVPPFDQEADPVNLAGLTAAQLELMRTRGTPQPFGTVTQPVRRPDPVPAIPASMIATTFSPEQIRALAAGGNPVFAGMSMLDLHHLPTGHWPMFSRPADLAALLAEVAG